MNGIRVAKIEEELNKLKVLKGRTPQTSEEEMEGVFATLGAFDTGGIFTGSFVGESSWERHTMGDELVYILKGETELTIMTNDGPEILNMKAGTLTVVPKGLWHRFKAPKGVTVLTATPHPTDHSNEIDPR
ncbi:cupin domain-containing protein [Emcibacteraceae bacterium]|nr:cupin domain-containing protein [Emcibacteraceae bacterium]MDA9554333.1 cupin domain-containing protein [Emcibacteraceae bacterium]